MSSQCCQKTTWQSSKEATLKFTGIKTDAKSPRSATDHTNELTLEVGRGEVYEGEGGQKVRMVGTDKGSQRWVDERGGAVKCGTREG